MKKHDISCICTDCNLEMALKTIFDLQSERDRLKKDAEFYQEQYNISVFEIDRLKAELEKSIKRNNSMCAELRQLKKCPECKVSEGVLHDEGCRVLLLLKDRDLWKSRAESEKGGK